ncbi:MAG: tRNA (adenosine(37)-N6)-threonylcarbamoyltransferase complex dimerization subunit type 1 TsaB [Clostridiaceae bacterium]|nr:tRNA (adenosine(37)-N6)-threonylcarbamoyltransferase complex dimerization subunit type 1 TsaB [Clostridiaceae bacterium]
MRILLINTALDHCVTALSEGGKIVCSLETPGRRAYANLLFRQIRELFDADTVAANEIDGIACVNGPGSFTGLRVGLAAAKGLALVHDLPIAPVNTLLNCCLTMYDADVRERMTPLPSTWYVSLLDARNERLYGAAYAAPVSDRPHWYIEHEPWVGAAADFFDCLEQRLTDGVVSLVGGRPNCRPERLVIGWAGARPEYFPTEEELTDRFGLEIAMRSGIYGFAETLVEMAVPVLSGMLPTAEADEIAVLSDEVDLPSTPKRVELTAVNAGNLLPLYVSLAQAERFLATSPSLPNS